MQYENIVKSINYEFENKNLLKTALTHTSYAHMHDVESNEKLEYLGDSILEFITSKYLYKNYMNLNEGEMTKLRATVVCEESLYEVAIKLELGKFLITSRGEGFGNVKNKAILADGVEAIIAAIYLDSGIENAEKFIIENLSEAIKKASKHVGTKDYKTVLQEKLQIHGNVKIEYTIISEEGPDHNKHFVAQVTCDDKFLANGDRKKQKSSRNGGCKKSIKRYEKLREE